MEGKELSKNGVEGNMSNRSKGMAYEREFEERLNNVGYITQRVKGSTKWNQNVDFFGYWDIIGFKPVGNWVLVQVKSNYATKYENELKEWVMKNKPKALCLLAIRNKGRRKDRWRIIAIE